MKEKLLGSSGPNYGSSLYIQVDRASGTYLNEVPNCDNPNWDFILDTGTDAGKFYATLILSAYMANKQVNLQGYDTCQGNVEGVRHVWLK